MSLSYECAVLLTRKTRFCNFRAMFVIFVTHLCELVAPFRGAVVGTNLAWGAHLCIGSSKSLDSLKNKNYTQNKEGLA